MRVTIPVWHGGVVSNSLTDRRLGWSERFRAPDSPMLIVCPSCATSYNVEPASLEPDGRRVRCVRCRTVWLAEPPHAAKLTAAASALAGPLEPDAPVERVAGGAAARAVTPVETAAEAGAVHLPQVRAGAPSPDALAEPATQGKPSEPAVIGEGSGEPGEVVEVEAPPIAPAGLSTADPPIGVDADRGVIEASAHAPDVETLAARRSQPHVKRAHKSWSLSLLHTSILILLIVDCILLGWRADVVRVLPQTASLYAAIGLGVNLRGLSFDGVTTASEAHDGVPFLIVQGNIINDSGTTIDVPRLKFVVRNTAKQEIYSWSTEPPLARLSPHQAVGFRSRLASPPPESSDVLVRFLNRRDSIADTR